MIDLALSGECDSKFDRIKQAFSQNFEKEQEIGASVCVYQNGKKVVDLWGGFANKAKTNAWEENTLVNVWSTTKGIMSLCVARLVDQGKLEMSETVSHYWPEFAANGKGETSVAQLFSHQGGLCGPSRPVSDAELLDTEFLAKVLAADEPQWPLGERSGYHALTIGPLADGLFKRVVGKTVGDYFREEIAEPTGVDFHMGLPESEDDRVAETVHDGNPPPGGYENFNKYQTLAQINVPVKPELANLRAWRAQGTPSAAGQGNARSVAQIYSALATDRKINGLELVSKEALEAATQVQINNEDLVLRIPMTWGIGFAINEGMQVYGPNPRTFGHHGWGGSFGFADPDTGISMAYAMNFMREPQDGVDPRIIALVQALFKSV